MKVLFVDDELPTTMQHFPDDLRSHEKITEVRAEGTIMMAKEVLSVKGGEYDMAIIDQKISGDEGTDLGAWINETNPHISCILITGGDKGDLQEVLVKAIESGFSSFLYKTRVLYNLKALHEQLDHILSLPGVQAKQKLKRDLIFERTRANDAIEIANDAIETANNAVKKIDQTWERFIESLERDYPIGIIAWTYIRLLCIEKCYDINPKIGVTDLNYVVPFLENLVSDTILIKYGYTFSSLQNTAPKLGRLSKVEAFIEETKQFLYKFGLKFQGHISDVSKEDKKIREEWDDILHPVNGPRKTLNALADFLNYRKFKKHIERQKKSMKVFMHSSADDFKHLIVKHPQFAELVMAIEQRVPLV